MILEMCQICIIFSISSITHIIRISETLMEGCSSSSISLKDLTEQFQNWRYKEFPEYATDLNIHNDRLQTLTLDKFDGLKLKCEAFLEQLLQINRDDLTSSDQASFDVLNDFLTTYISGYKWRYYSACNPVVFLENVHINFKSFIINATPFLVEKDFLNYIQRIKCIPQQILEQIDLMKEAISHKTTLHRLSVEKVPGQLDNVIGQDVETNLFYEPCVKYIKLVEGEEKRKSICSTIKSVIKNEINPAFAKLREFLEFEYIPACREHYGVGSLFNGKEYYKACLKWHLSADISPEEVHQRGIDEVLRLQKSFKDVMKQVDFRGSLSEFFLSLRQGSFYRTSDVEILREYKEILENRINPKISSFFHDPPIHGCDVRSMPFDGPLGYYNPPSRDGSSHGVFQVNLTKPETIPTFSMPVLTLHETNPGHHLQASHALQLPIPCFRKKIDFRNIYSAPMLFPVYTAYLEGWAMYAEDLGMEMRVYETPYEVLGKYFDEMYRACRLVVDTGIHYFGWSRDEAIHFMSENCLMSSHKIENEVDRYITWPGQACAYKIGQMKIRELRLKAEEALGSEFDIKDFHDTILNMAFVPLSVLERHINDWIKSQVK